MGGYGIYNAGSHEAFISESGSRTIVDQRLNNLYNTASDLPLDELGIVFQDLMVHLNQEGFSLFIET